ncbi:transient receptor potential cation channel protein painless-like [Temnothorax curvispinosus]|uniref:Transient receptor potential cation channel protein painless-like n=1 Tax=Temnothorax curvispinosus TaxID=300111 RepID=A0A6J1Q358_9HYME|nr:transient receptor potential cation channel protein painless-like [Temnothorax curvispinosus]
MGKELSEKLPFKSENWKRDAQAVLEDSLKNRNETSFLTYVEDIQGEIPPCLVENLLTISAQHNWQKAVKAILNRFEKKHGQGTNSYLSVKEAARTAVQNGRYVIFEELLKVEPEISHHLILSVCLKLGEPRKRGVNDTLLRSNLKTCLEMILKQINVDVCCIDIADISSVLSAYFDDCLKKIRNQTKEDVIEYDYSCLMSHNIFSIQNTTHRGTCETEVFLDIARNKNLNHLLKHPLLSSFLYQKWCKIRHILYTNIGFYGIFYFLLNTYILNMIYESSPNENGTQTVNDSFDVILNSTLLIRFYPESLLWIFVIVLWLLFTIWEILLFACCPRRYLMNWENRLQVVLIIFTLILLCGAGAWSRVVVVLLSALVLTTLISQHPKISTNFEIF